MGPIDIRIGQLATRIVREIESLLPSRDDLIDMEVWYVPLDWLEKLPPTEYAGKPAEGYVDPPPDQP